MGKAVGRGGLGEATNKGLVAVGDGASGLKGLGDGTGEETGKARGLLLAMDGAGEWKGMTLNFARFLERRRIK